ncbi:MAG: DUF5985 family protein [Verrucomicrobia subdivision 3 bacterium]|nr:DUF5985 family protein [Limisphaerales bacterium]
MKAVINEFLSGALMLAYLAIGLFFLRFWRKTHDQFFAVFAAAFWVLALERIILLVQHPGNEFRPYIYLVRLIAFLLIIGAIIVKNRSSGADGAE